MIYWLFNLNADWLKSMGFYAWQNVLFRSILALLTAFFLTMWLGPKFIRYLRRKKIGDRPEFYRTELNESLKTKAATPTMGGIMIVIAIIFATLLWADIANYYVQMAIVVVVWLAVLGGHDDWLKLTRKDSRNRRGLFGWEKLVFQVGLGVVIAYFAYAYGQNMAQSITPAAGQARPEPHVLNLPFYRDQIVMSPLFFAILTVIVMTGTSNAVNLTDGMDGLSAGCMLTVAFAFAVLAIVAGYGEDGKLAQYLLMPWVPTADELAVFCAAIVGACVGFLWFNCHPAQVFMGDTGSLPLGGAIGYVAIIVRQELMLLIVGGVFVMEAVSVILQVAYFRMTGGRRIFRCAPIHYHFFMGGWTETQTVMRFWLLGAIFAAFALATVKFRFGG